jgi:hypothetical protein
MSRLLFMLSLALFIISCGKDIANALASNAGSTLAPWRITREAHPYELTNAEKDAVCRASFGSDYMAGMEQEFYGLATGRHPGTVFLFAENNYGVYFQSNGTVSTNNYPGKLFCIRR